MVGSLPIFQANQLTQAVVDIGLKPLGIQETFIPYTEISSMKLIIGVVLCILISIVIVGGIQRIGNWAGSMVPLMIVLHFISVTIILTVYAHRIPHYVALIFTDAFSAKHYHGDPFLGGMLGGIIMLGVRRATFSNEAGIGTAPMAMSAAKSTEPVREGLISMLSPFIDTIISCTPRACHPGNRCVDHGGRQRCNPHLDGLPGSDALRWRLGIADLYHYLRNKRALLL